MKENTIPFVTALKSYVEQRTTKINDKNTLLENLKDEFASKKEEIIKVEAEYKQTFSDDTFDKLQTLKNEGQRLEADINKAGKMISLMDIGEFAYDKSTLEAEISSFIDDIKFDKLKKSVVNAKEEYLKTINNYSEGLNTAYTLKNTLDSMCNNITKENRNKILSVLNIRSKEFGIENDMFIKQYDNNNIPMKLNKEAINIYMKLNGGI